MLQTIERSDLNATDFVVWQWSEENWKWNNLWKFAFKETTSKIQIYELFQNSNKFIDGFLKQPLLESLSK